MSKMGFFNHDAEFMDSFLSEQGQYNIDDLSLKSTMLTIQMYKWFEF